MDINRKSSDARIAANARYNAKTYKRYAVNTRLADAEMIDNYFKSQNLSGSAGYIAAVKYCIDNNIDLSDNP